MPCISSVALGLVAAHLLVAVKGYPALCTAWRGRLGAFPSALHMQLLTNSRFIHTGWDILGGQTLESGRRTRWVAAERTAVSASGPVTSSSNTGVPCEKGLLKKPESLRMTATYDQFASQVAANDQGNTTWPPHGGGLLPLHQLPPHQDIP